MAADPTEHIDVDLVADADGRSSAVLDSPGATGHLWLVESADGVELVGTTRAVEPPGPDGPVGGGFEERFEFRGTGTLALVLRQPWDAERAPWKRVAFTVTARP